MDYKKMPADARGELGEMMEAFRQRVGEKAFAELMDISRRLEDLKIQYGQEPQPDNPKPQNNEEFDFLELSMLFYAALAEDPVIKDRPAEEPLDEATTKAAVQRTIARLRAEGKIISDEIAEALPSIAARRVKQIDFPIDKLNANIWLKKGQALLKGGKNADAVEALTKVFKEEGIIK